MSNQIALQREVTATQLTQLSLHPHAALTDWALRNHANWLKYQNEQPLDARDWHVAKVEAAHWAAMIEMLKGRAQ